MKRLIFILILLVIIFYFQYPFINKLNNTYEILQFDNPNKSKLVPNSNKKIR